MFYKLLRPHLKSLNSHTYKRGDLIYSEGEAAQQIFLIDSGIIGLFHLSESGKETFLRIFGEDHIFGHRSFFAQTNYHANAIALTSTDVLIISGPEFNSICDKNPELLKEITKTIANSLGESELRLAGLFDKTAKARIVEGLIYLKLRYPKHVWTRKEIAEFSGSTYESVTRVMTELSNMDLITKQGRNFVIPDTGKLLLYSKEKF
jgi:CRP-like cAMP-binding protein